MKCLCWTDEKGWRKGGYLVLNLFHEYCFLPEPIATCCGPSHPFRLDGNFCSFPPCRLVPAALSPHLRPVSACSSASLPFSSILLNLCPASNNPYSVSPVYPLISQGLLATCFLLTFILKMKTSSGAPGSLVHGICAASFAVVIFWV